MNQDVLSNKDTQDFNEVELPTNHYPKKVVKVQFKKGGEVTTATVRGVHIYDSHVKYDLGLWLGDGSVDDPEIEARVYNVDSRFVTA